MSEAVWLTDHHRAFGETVRRFLQREYEPNRAEWTRERRVPHASRIMDLVTYMEQGHGGYGYMNEYHIAEPIGTPGCNASTAARTRSCAN